MEVSKEALLDELNDFEKKRPSEIPPTLEDYLIKIAKTGDTLFPWPKVKVLVQKKLELVMSEFYESCPTDSISNIPNVDSFKFEALKEKILEAVDSFNSAPFTIQRICELITSPKKHYKRTDKFMRGLEKNILVVSTVEPTVGRRLEVNNNGNILINGVLELPSAISDLLPTNNNDPSTSLANHAAISDSGSICSNNAICIDNDPSAYTRGVINGTLEPLRMSPSSSPSSSSSNMTVSSASMFPSEIQCSTNESVATPGDSESSSSSDSDSSSDSLTADYPKDILAADSTSRRISNHQHQQQEVMAQQQPQQQPYQVALPDQPCTSQAQTMLPTTDINQMDTTPDHPSPTTPDQQHQSEPPPEEGVSSSDVRQDMVPVGLIVDDSIVLNNGNVLVADSTESGSDTNNTTLNVSTSESNNLIVPESSIVDPGLSLGDELSVVKEVAENLVETLLSQNVSSADELPTGILLPGTPTSSSSSQEIVNEAAAATIEGEVTSLNLDIPDVAVHFPANIIMGGDNGDEAQSTLSEKIEIADNMETDLTLSGVVASSTSVTTSSQSVIHTQQQQQQQQILSSPTLTPLPDQSEPMEQD